jgi:predicted N-acetyltransferase YhbS
MGFASDGFTMTEPAIRLESPVEAATITAIIRESFRTARVSSHTEHFIVAALRNADALTLSLVAEEGERMVGHIAFSPVSISDGATDWYGLGPVSVVPSSQGTGLGSRLITDGLAKLRQLGAKGCVVLGEPDYYGRFGFVSVPTLVLPGVPQRIFLSQSLGGPLPAGEVLYHEAFDAEA